MSRRWILIMGLGLIVVGILGFIFKSSLKSGQAGVHIETTPQATVFIDDQQVGTTPYDGVHESGEITLKLVPQGEKNLSAWSTRITLASGIKTVVRRDFGEIVGKSAGEILSFEKLSGSLTSLTIVSTPDGAQISLDGEIRGFTPLPINSVAEGDHKILVTQPGYLDREIQARTYPGYKLTVIAQLAQSDEAQNQSVEEASGSAGIAQGPKQSMIEIGETPVGYLRVRSEPNKNATESAQLKPGDKVPYLDQTSSGDWFKIEYETGKIGWISSQYAKKVDEGQ